MLNNRSSQAGPPHGEASTSPAPLHASSQAREGGALPQASATPTPPGEDASLSQVSTPLPPFPPSLPLPGKMPVFPRSIPPLPPSPSRLPLPGKTPVFPRSVPTLPPFPPSLLLSCLHRKTGDFPTSPTPKQVKPTTHQTILGKVAGTPQGKGPPRPPRRFILPPGKAITPLPPH